MIVDTSSTETRFVDEERNMVSLSHERARHSESGFDLDSIEHEIEETTRIEFVDDDPGPIDVPDVDVHVESHGDELTWENAEAEVPPDTVIELCAPVRVLVRSPDVMHLMRDDDGLSLVPESTTVDLAVGSKLARPQESVVIPRTAEGVAQWITAAGAALAETTSPDRSWPAVRSHPPLVEWGDSIEIQGVDGTNTDIEVRVPESRALEHLFSLSSLSAYLGASVRVDDDRDRATVCGPSWSEHLGESPEETDRRASDLLRRVVFLDCYVRREGPHGRRLLGDPLDSLHLDAESLYRAPMRGRLRTYLAVDTDLDLPEWHLGTFVQPSFDSVRALPDLVRRLSDVWLPACEELDVGDRVEWCSDQSFARGVGMSLPEPVVDPVDRPAETTGWLAPERAIGAFNLSVSACESRRSQPVDDRRLSVSVVINAPAMDDERVVADHYQRDDLLVDVDLRRSLSVSELAQVFESRHDVVHFVGHRDDDGLRCSDGHLSTASLAESNARTFCLNACGSLPEARDLVAKGSIAGVCTVEDTANESAVSVGTDWSRLVSMGWTVERALDTARRATDSPSSFVSLGDGTHVVTQSDALSPPRVFVDELGEREVEVTVDHRSPRAIGREVVGVVDDDTPHLTARERSATLSRDEWSDLCRRLDSPVVFDGDLRWDQPPSPGPS